MESIFDLEDYASQVIEEQRAGIWCPCGVCEERSRYMVKAITDVALEYGDIGAELIALLAHQRWVGMIDGPRFLEQREIERRAARDRLLSEQRG